MDNEKKFKEKLENILGREKAIEILIIDEPSDETKWFVSLRITEMIRDYYKAKLEKEIQIYFSFLLEDIIPTINKMNPNDIHILRIQAFGVEGMTSYLYSERAKKKNFS